jgi:YjbE family integral membrane protein
VDWGFLAGLFQIVVIDLSLSGDNAIVIGMAAASLPRNRRTKAIVIGGACAILLRIALTVVATTLMKVTLISAAGGLVLFWVAWKLLRMDVEEEEESEAEKARSASNFRQAIILILTADFMMSLDNVLAVAGAANGNDAVLIIGLLLSMPLLMTTGGALSRLIDKFKWIPFFGAAVICFAATRMILEDHFIEPRLGISGTAVTLIGIAVAIVIPGVILLFNRQRVKRSLAKKHFEPRELEDKGLSASLSGQDADKG